MLTDSDCSHVREDLIIWVTTRSLYCIFETNIRLFIKDTSTKKKGNLWNGRKFANHMLDKC